MISDLVFLKQSLTGGGKYSSHLNFFDFCVVTELYNILSWWKNFFHTF